MQFALGVAGLVALFLMILFMPETSQPGARGIDKLMLEDEDAGKSPKWRWVWLNPLESLWLLRSPNLLAVASLVLICSTICSEADRMFEVFGWDICTAFGLWRVPSKDNCASIN